uniref:Beta-lactamase-related domain-containing protein n=1 Tax=Chromera velia CCMP2878 TaxID=1169474 RepID=A0A0G4HTJ9_9ALVE|mmetsp:Transcript_16255/g.32938  ORF Transcript_16255/g.32938 Transcript_16255/m.32938 type:complete len:450 (-) Transcript_16255:812-2161(-)|eukprot:Cvel_8494.t1-p1 / transcript=Cvel_8494.t1 / gene=Cvel_8494 / organism=Chromera_velia_CCMP2878 / gene_product=D-alanyl-D-alanine carboxypeptidase, putative / transcript_product=D-alanyl-D-alanine carboxypeptidase, putative / location=Cvel_scaffold469:64881-66729(-) / protein_length=449 / sequence_SO=supercontig / SO=protein_coding / is_pseudo=false
MVLAQFFPLFLSLGLSVAQVGAQLTSNTSCPVPVTSCPLNFNRTLDFIFRSRNRGYGGVTMSVSHIDEAGNINTIFEGASGLRSTPINDPIRTTDTYEIASVTKLMTAAQLLILQERGLLSLDDKVTSILPWLPKDLHVFNGTNYSNNITVGQLLRHSSGLPDYFYDGPKQRRVLPTTGKEMNANDFVHWAYNYVNNSFWEENEYMDPKVIMTFVPALDTHFPPGGPRKDGNPPYHYSDSNFVLSGLIIENVTGLSLGNAFRRDIWNPLGMNSTFMRWTEGEEWLSRPEVRLSERYTLRDPTYVDNHSITRAKGESSDWAGGGVASTNKDLTRFMSGLVSGWLLKPESLDTMLSWRETRKNSTRLYGLGTFGWDLLYEEKKEAGLIEEGAEPVVDLLGHDGWGNAFAYFYTPLRVAFTGTLNNADSRNLFVEVIRYGVKQLLPCACSDA